MKPEEAKDILSDMRDQHLCFLGKSEIKDEWQEKYLKEAWACDSGAKTLAGLITGIKIDKGVIAESILHYGKIIKVQSVWKNAPNSSSQLRNHTHLWLLCGCRKK